VNVEITKFLQGESYKKSLEKPEGASQAAERVSQARSAAPAHQGDRVSLSNDARLRTQAFTTAMSTPDVREDRIAALKEQIANGSYKVDSHAIAQKLLQEDDALYG
jgi:negative regulator of flagellin synthesis FlgM